jgi:hypothetical protein
MLPFVKLGMFVPSVRRNPSRWYAADARLLARFPFLSTFAMIRVFELVKAPVDGPTAASA